MRIAKCALLLLATAHYLLLPQSLILKEFNELKQAQARLEGLVGANVNQLRSSLAKQAAAFDDCDPTDGPSWFTSY